MLGIVSLRLCVVFFVRVVWIYVCIATVLVQMSPTGEHVSDVSDVLTVGQVVDVRIREVSGTSTFTFFPPQPCFSCSTIFSLMVVPAIFNFQASKFIIQIIFHFLDKTRVENYTYCTHTTNSSTNDGS